MVTIKEVDAQLKQLGLSFRFWGRPEVLELAQILIPGEQIRACMNGRYEGGFAMLCATDQRLLLIDKKLFHLSLEDIRYDMVAEVDYGTQFISANLRVCTPNKNLVFLSFKPRALRQLGSYLQQRVMEIRQQYTFQSLQQHHQYAPLQQQPFASMAPQPMASAEARLIGGDQPAETGVDGVNPEVPSLPMPQFRNPYTQAPLMMRRRIGRFGPLPNTQ